MNRSANRELLLAFVVTLGPVLLGLALIDGCLRAANNPSHHVKSWHTELQVVKERFPFLHSASSSAWGSGIAHFRWGLAPSSWFIKGYAVFGEKEFDELKSAHQWVESTVKVEDLQVPPNAPHFSGPILEGVDLGSELNGIGRAFLLPESRAVYFDVVRD